MGNVFEVVECRFGDELDVGLEGEDGVMMMMMTTIMRSSIFRSSGLGAPTMSSVLLLESELIGCHPGFYDMETVDQRMWG